MGPRREPECHRELSPVPVDHDHGADESQVRPCQCSLSVTRSPGFHVVSLSRVTARVDRIDQPTGVRSDGVLTAPTFATTPTHVLLPHREDQVPPTREQDRPVASDRILALEWHAIDVEREGNRELPSWLGLYDMVLFVLWAPVSCKNLVTQPLLEPWSFSDFLGQVFVHVRAVAWHHGADQGAAQHSSDWHFTEITLNGFGEAQHCVKLLAEASSREAPRAQ